jgi:hypothetical protein
MVFNLTTHHMQRFAILREADHQTTFSSARIFVLFKHPTRQQGFFYFSHSQVVILSLLVTMSRKVVSTLSDLALYPDYIKHFLASYEKL